MHELAITQNILALACQYAQEAKAVRITDITLLIGELSSVIDDSVQFYWDMISADTLAAGSVLHFERQPACMRCDRCSRTYTLAESELICPYCQSVTVTILRGDEFLLQSIVVEKNATPSLLEPEAV
ncbi:MAG: hydrogenase maturation nickel metallochaperone HypA [Anaerolineae bacterium]|nr:hydrogenase maturation nickel metallochaperone HypA [Anaerolineae bacterium]